MSVDPLVFVKVPFSGFKCITSQTDRYIQFKPYVSNGDNDIEYIYGGWSTKFGTLVIYYIWNMDVL